MPESLIKAETNDDSTKTRKPYEAQVQDYQD